MISSGLSAFKSFLGLQDSVEDDDFVLVVLLVLLVFYVVYHKLKTSYPVEAQGEPFAKKPGIVQVQIQWCGKWFVRFVSPFIRAYYTSRGLWL